MGCGGSKIQEKEKIQFLKTLNTIPNLKRYGADSSRITTFTKAWLSKGFGGSVLQPLGGLKGKRTRYNVLDQQIDKAQINQMFGGGYYIIDQVQQLDDDNTWFYDIQILIENIKDNDLLEQLRGLNEAQNQLLKKKGQTVSTQKDFIKFNEIKESMTGWARVVSYSVTKPGSTDDLDKRLEAVYEGHFEQGLKDGYVRGISAVDGSCSAGMHSKDIVNGKFLAFKATGEIGKPEGFYEGSKLKQEITIQNFYQSSNQHEIKMKK